MNIDLLILRSTYQFIIHLSVIVQFSLHFRQRYKLGYK